MEKLQEKIRGILKGLKLKIKKWIILTVTKLLKTLKDKRQHLSMQNGQGESSKSREACSGFLLNHFGISMRARGNSVHLEANVFEQPTDGH